MRLRHFWQFNNFFWSGSHGMFIVDTFQTNFIFFKYLNKPERNSILELNRDKKEVHRNRVRGGDSSELNLHHRPTGHAFNSTYRILFTFYDILQFFMAFMVLSSHSDNELLLIFKFPTPARNEIYWTLRFIYYFSTNIRIYIDEPNNNWLYCASSSSI